MNRRTLNNLSKTEHDVIAERMSEILDKPTIELLKLADKYSVDRNQLLERASVVFFISNKRADFTNFEFEEDTDEEV